MANFHYPAPCTVARDLPSLLVFLPPAPNMGDIAPALRLLPTGFVVITLVQTHMVERFRRGLRPLQHRSIQGGRQQFHVVAIGPRPDHRNGNALPLRQHTALGPALAPVRGIGTRGLAPKGALVIAPSTRCQIHSSPFSSS